MVENCISPSAKDLINLTFCCQQATVITDFTNFEERLAGSHGHPWRVCQMEELELAGQVKPLSY